MTNENNLTRQTAPHRLGLAAMIGTSPRLLELKATIRQLLDAEQCMPDGELPAILVQGEAGSGKELAARALHYDLAGRTGPLVQINCASIPSYRLGAELFGHEEGAFADAKERKIGLVEAADGGTLLLDEVGAIDLSVQARLLQLVTEKTFRRLGAAEDKKVNLRIVATTHRNLGQMMSEGRFRGDLYYRLRVISLTVPPLRTRGSDVLLLARHFLAQHGQRYGKANLAFSPDAEDALLRHDWPGNIRELRDALEQIVLLARDAAISAEQLAIGGVRVRRDTGGDVIAAPPATPGLADAAKDMLVKILAKTDWDITKSAKLLGLSLDVMRYRIEKLNLAPPGA